MEWSESDILKFGGQVTRLVADYYAALETQPITPRDPAAIDALFGGGLPEEGSDPFALLADVTQRVLPNSFHLASPAYFGLFNPTPTVIGVFADAIASLINQNMGAWSHGPAGANIEKTVIRWLCDLMGYPAASFGSLTGGGTLANLTALKVALSEKVAGSRLEGVAAAPGRPTFYVSSQAHFSLARCADVLGIGLDGVRSIECDASGRIQVALLEKQITADRKSGRLPFCVVGIAGTTVSGAIDPLGPLADLCAAHGLWYHVDAAWGGAVRLSHRHAALLAGIERADSITLDPHKWLSVPFTAGAVVTKDGSALRRTFEATARYLGDRTLLEHENLNYFQMGLAGTRRLDALKVWLSLRQYGRRGYADSIERQVQLAEYLARQIAASDDMELMSQPSLGVMCFRVVPKALAGREAELDALQMKIQYEVEQRGRAWISTAVLNGHRVIRFCVTSYLARERHVDRMLEEVRAASLTASGGPSRPRPSS